MKYQPVSVCIAAHNEESCITQTLDSILKQTYPEEIEVLVGVNGSTDRTAEVVQAYSQQHPEVKLIELDEKGKPNAWNVLMEEAKNNYRFFVDGDVIVGTDAFFQMYKKIEEDKLIGVGTNLVPVLEGCDLLTQAMAPPQGPSGVLCGRLYVVNNDRLQERLAEQGIEEMPKDIIHEDAWLTIAIGRGNWDTEMQADVFYRPYHWSEFSRVHVRYIKAKEQLKEIFPMNYLPTTKNSFVTRNTHRVKKLMGIPGMVPKLTSLAGYAAKRVAFTVAEQMAKRKVLDSPLDAWEISEFSKELMPWKFFY